MLVDTSGSVIDTDNQVIYNIPTSLNLAEEFKSYYNNLGLRVTVLNAQSDIATNVSTGGTVVLAGKKYTTVMTGDVNGDGHVDGNDIILLLDYVNGKETLEGIYKQAGLVSGGDEITLDDVLSLIAIVNGEPSKTEITEKFDFPVSELLASFDDGFEYTVYKNGKLISSDNTTSTGMVIIGIDYETKTVIAKEVAVLGDVNGDGRVYSNDYLGIKRCIKNPDRLTGVYFIAGDMNFDGKLNAVDYLRVKSKMETTV